MQGGGWASFAVSVWRRYSWFGGLFLGQVGEANQYL